MKQKKLKEQKSKRAVTKPLLIVALSITAIIVLVFLSTTKKGLTVETETLNEL
ncbi:hypothetical protein HY640_03580, partial [Candidatus Woesearchaeota archaeon]|nr:hypothetical protein [Candidatus Woesearchaeota archaeon]